MRAHTANPGACPSSTRAQHTSAHMLRAGAQPPQEHAHGTAQHNPARAQPPATRKSTTLDSTCTRSTHGTAQPAPGTTHARAAQQTTRDAQRTDTHDQHTHAREPLLLSQSARLELLAPRSFRLSRLISFRVSPGTPAARCPSLLTAPNLYGTRALLPALASTTAAPSSDYAQLAASR
jgi:hypothetical protein